MSSRIKDKPAPYYTGIMFGLRQTGRTYRMLQAACRAYREGKLVTIVFDTVQEKKSAKEQYEKAFGKVPRGKVRFTTKSVERVHIDWTTLKWLYPERQAIELFVDHAVIESVHRGLLHALHRHDTVDVRQIQLSLHVMSETCNPRDFTNEQRLTIRKNKEIFDKTKVK
jgi:hypothetical protein